VNADPHPHVGVDRPAPARERALDRHSRVNGRSWRFEHGEELVGAGLHLVAALPGDATTQHRPYLVDECVIALPEALHQRRRAFDVGHQHRDESRGQRDGAPFVLAESSR